MASPAGPPSRSPRDRGPSRPAESRPSRPPWPLPPRRRGTGRTRRKPPRFPPAALCAFITAILHRVDAAHCPAPTPSVMPVLAQTRWRWTSRACTLSSRRLRSASSSARRARAWSPLADRPATRPSPAPAPARRRACVSARAIASRVIGPPCGSSSSRKFFLERKFPAPAAITRRNDALDEQLRDFRRPWPHRAGD